MAVIGTDVNEAKKFLEQGNVVAIPTETVYGLAGNALNSDSVSKIFTVKNRPQFDPLIVHVPNRDAVSKYVSEFPPKAQALAEAFWPGPLTLLLKRKAIIPDLVTSGLDTVGIRCPDHSLTRSLLLSLDFPLAAPSANPFGYVSPTSAWHVDAQLGPLIPYILDGGVCEVGIESTIVGFEDDMPIVYRMGGLQLEQIEKVVGGKVVVQTHSTSNPKAPGQLKSHYAPRTKVMLGSINELTKKYASSRFAILSFNKDYKHEHQIILSKSGDTNEAAKNLFASLRDFDKMPVDIVFAELVPEIGLGRAINDRLRRAAAE